MLNGYFSLSTEQTYRSLHWGFVVAGFVACLSGRYSWKSAIGYIVNSMKGAKGSCQGVLCLNYNAIEVAFCRTWWASVL